jgi:hypothetical protein
MDAHAPDGFDLADMQGLALDGKDLLPPLIVARTIVAGVVAEADIEALGVHRDDRGKVSPGARPDGVKPFGDGCDTPFIDERLAICSAPRSAASGRETKLGGHGRVGSGLSGDGLRGSDRR